MKNIKKILIFFLFLYFFKPCLNNNMVLIPDGSYMPLFKYGDKVEEVFLKSFKISEYPVTNHDFMKFLEEKPEWQRANILPIFADANYLINFDKLNATSFELSPVINVSWFAADAYCRHIGGRLPSIDEWEYVASAGVNNANGKNEPYFLQDILDWYISSQSKPLISIVDMKKNFFGVYGLHGIIWEWVSDFNSVILLNTDAEGGGLEEVLYCGATATNAVDPADYVAFMRFAFRNSLEADYTSSSLGFRCVEDVK